MELIVYNCLVNLDFIFFKELLRCFHDHLLLLVSYD